MKVYAWLTDLIHRRKIAPGGWFPGGSKKWPKHRRTIQHLLFQADFHDTIQILSMNDWTWILLGKFSHVVDYVWACQLGTKAPTICMVRGNVIGSGPPTGYCETAPKRRKTSLLCKLANSFIKSMGTCEIKSITPWIYRWKRIKLQSSLSSVWKNVFLCHYWPCPYLWNIGRGVDE